MKKRLIIIILAGVLLVAGAALYKALERPETVPPDVHKKGIESVTKVLLTCADSEFGKTDRGMNLLTGVSYFLKKNKIGFTPEITKQALLREESGGKIIYIKVMAGVKGIYILPDNEDLAEVLFHEALHFVQNNDSESWEEEIDAFHAAEEGRAAYLGVEPQFPLKRDGIPIEQWVKQNYPDLKSDPAYKPLK